MAHVNVCENSKFEWRNGELFAVSDAVEGDTAWLDSQEVELMRKHYMGAPIQDGEFPFYVIQRMTEGDRVYKVDDYVVFPGGDVLCFIEPIVGLH